jgi:xanthine dehydrogenase accessory factor
MQKLRCETVANHRSEGRRGTISMNDSLAQQACALLADKVGFVIATIVGHQGSTPRTAGTKMLVTGEGRATGTIGGGLLEARVVEKARRIVNRQEASIFMPFDLSHRDVETMDMICGGQAEIFLDHILPSRENVELFNRWHRMIRARRNGFFITVVSGRREAFDRVCRGISNDHGSILAGTLPLAPGELEAIVRKARRSSRLRIFRWDATAIIVEPAFKPAVAFLFGAGHVARPTARLCTLTGFCVTVVDDRREFANRGNFPHAQDIRVVENFETALSGLHIENDSFVIIFTRGHLHDKTVLAAALHSPAGYIGMIGSMRKRDAIYGALLESGFDRQDLERVHSPIGLEIGAESPEEIAVSIVAEMILERSRMKK